MNYLPKPLNSRWRWISRRSDRQRMLQLAELSEAGTLTAEEQMEFDGYLHVGNLLAVMQSKARLALKLKRKSQDRERS
jgi:hypothetical protein